jgi:hypothetical protein
MQILVAHTAVSENPSLRHRISFTHLLYASALTMRLEGGLPDAIHFSNPNVASHSQVICYHWTKSNLCTYSICIGNAASR